jgi:hypothetical protein
MVYTRNKSNHATLVTLVILAAFCVACLSNTRSKSVAESMSSYDISGMRFSRSAADLDSEMVSQIDPARAYFEAEDYTFFCDLTR